MHQTFTLFSSEKHKYWMLTTTALGSYFTPNAEQKLTIFGLIGMKPLIELKKKYAITSTKGLKVSFTRNTCLILKINLFTKFTLSCSQGRTSSLPSFKQTEHWCTISLYCTSSSNSFLTSSGFAQPRRRQRERRASFCRPLDSSQMGVSGTWKQKWNLLVISILYEILTFCRRN